MIHRAGLSETVLVFDNHLSLIGGRKALPEHLAALREAACEKTVTVECHDIDQARSALAAGADAVQFDKIPVGVLREWLDALRGEYPQASLLIAGGLRHDNIRDYAATGIDGLVLFSVYHAPPADLGVTIRPLESC